MIVPVHCPTCDATVSAERKSSSNVVVCPTCGAEASAPLGLVEGTVLGNGYRIDSLKSETKQGDVFLGFQTTMEREVQIKTLAPHLTNDEEAMGRFLREAKLTGGLQHPNILHAIDAGEDCGIYFLVSDYRAGSTLKDHLEASEVLDEKQAIEWLVPIMRALKHAWDEKKILHRNVKPEHILLPESGPPLLTDLGIARSLENDSMDLTGTDFTVGTPEYMSPEQIEGENMDTRADMYSLGVVLFECVTGQRPFQSVSAVELLTMHLEQAPPRADEADGVSRRCADLIDRMLAKAPGERFATWDAAIEAAESVLSGSTTVISTPEPLPEPPAAPRKRNPKAKPKAKPKAEGVSRRDVERIAAQMDAKSAARNRTIMWALSVIVPIAIFAFVMNKKDGASPPPPPPTGIEPIPEPRPSDRAATSPAGTETPAPTPSPAPAAALPPAGAGDDSFAGMYSYAESFFRDNPTDFEGSIAKFERVKEDTAGSKFALMAEESIAKVRSARAAHIAKITSDLRRDALKLADAGNVAAAIRTVETFAGPFATETKLARGKLLATLLERQEAESAVASERQAILRSAEASIARSILRTPQQAQRFIATMLRKPELADSAARFKPLVDFAESAAAIDSHIARGFKRDIGKTITVNIKGKDLEIEVVNASAARVDARRIIREDGRIKGRVGIIFSLADVPLETRVERLRMAAPDDVLTLAAVLAYSAGQRSWAVTQLRGVETPVARTLLQHAGN